MTAVTDFLLNRSSEPRLESPAPDSTTLERAFSCAARAPDHALLRPWRYLVIEGKGLEALGSTGNQQLEAAVKASYGSTIKVDSVRALADATLSFQTDMHGLTETYRVESSNASRDIADAVEESKRKFAALLSKAA